MAVLCSICLDLDVDFECPNCLNLNCDDCVKSNDDRCCFCNAYRDECEQEVYFQLSLLARTHENLNTKSVEKFESVKKCPGCTILIEKIDEDCNQIYCTFCKTVWEWESEHIVTDFYDIHNPSYHERFEKIEITTTDDRIDRAVSKCLKMLSKERSRYITDTYIYRLMFLIDEYSMREFRDKIKIRYRLLLKYLKLKKILEEKRYDDIVYLDPNWVISDVDIRLPYI